MSLIPIQQVKQLIPTMKWIANRVSHVHSGKRSQQTLLHAHPFYQ